MSDVYNLTEYLILGVMCISIVGLIFALSAPTPSPVNMNSSPAFDKNIVWNKSIFPSLFIIERSAEIFCEIKGYDFVNKFTVGMNGDFSCTKGFTGKERTFLNGTTYVEMSYTSHSFPLKCLETVYLKDVECRSKLEDQI